MDKTYDILLNSSISKKSVNKNTTLNIPLHGNKKLLPEDAISDTMDLYDVYLQERKNGNKFRLILNINPFCSNVLFNPFTEIVKDEGSDDVLVLNYEGEMTTGELNEKIGVENAIVGKTDDVIGNFRWNRTSKRQGGLNGTVPTNYEAIRDTQLSNDRCGFVYHCGADIFNNHILRSRTFKAINYNEVNSKKSLGDLGTNAYGNNYKGVLVNEQGTPHVYIDGNFNTIDDYMRDKDGFIVSDNFPKIVDIEYWNMNPYAKRFITLPLHLYQNYDISSYEEAYKDKLKEENGWYGFYNQSTINTIATVENVSSEMDINKVINNRNYNDFIDMYPGRDLYSFTPKYNKERERLESNWNYCLTYPSESLKVMDNGVEFPFIRVDESGNTSLRVYMFDDMTKDDDGIDVLTVYSICKHGLQVGDHVNIYKTDKLFYDSSEVIHIIDNYIFQVVKESANMSDMWIEVENRNVTTIIENGISTGDKIEGPENRKRSSQRGGIYVTGGERYPICESNRCNVDPDAQDIHFRRVVNGVECKYYVRKFSRLPNFKFRDEEVNDFTLYHEGSDLIERYSDVGHDFENHIGKLGFANTAYGDDTVEIVYTDDIDVTHLRDNLGRPVSDIFLTIVKNNKGYHEWYGINHDIDPGNENVEYSHCFGKNNCGFLLSEYFRENRSSNMETRLNSLGVWDVRDITATNNKGLPMFLTKNGENPGDEIKFEDTLSYYGDICCFSPVDCDEQILQTTMNRFNTVQRELADIHGEAFQYYNFGMIIHDEIQDTENTLAYNDSHEGDPYDHFKDGYLRHTSMEAIGDAFGVDVPMNSREGYYHQAHYRIPLRTVSVSLSTDNAISYEIVEIKMDGNLFEFKTRVNNDFLKNDKAVLYKRSTNEYYYIAVNKQYSSYRFNCSLTDENGNSVQYVDGMLDIKHIDDYVILKKADYVPSYARIMKDGSCKYCWREVISNGIEEEEKVYPFANGAFYITQRINFFLRRQDPKKENLGISWFTPDGEDISDYPNFMPFDKANYEEEEIERC